jgi:ribose transport system permease protein
MSALDVTPSFRDRIRSLPPWVAPLLALIALVAITTTFNPLFVKPENLINILRQWSFVGIIAVGMTFVITLGGIDLSVGSLLAFIGGFGILTMNSIMTAGVEEATGVEDFFASVWTTIGVAEKEGWAVAIAFLTMLVLGTLAGSMNGLLIAKGKLAPFIATLGGLAAYRSLALAMADGGEYRSSSRDLFGEIGQGGIAIPGTNIAPNAPRSIPLEIPWPVIIFFAMVLLGCILLNRTRYGRYVQAIGCNEKAAIYSAINVDRVKILTYMLIGFCTGIAALLLGSRMNSISSAGTGILYELDVIAAVVIGGTRMRGGSGTIFGTVIGVLILGVVGNMMTQLDVSPYLQGLVKGSIIVLAVLAQRAERE